MSVVSTVHNITRTVPGTLRMVGVEPCLSVHQTLSKCRPVVTRPTRLCGGRAQLLSRTPATRKKLYLERRGFLVMSSARSHTAEFQQDS